MTVLNVRIPSEIMKSCDRTVDMGANVSQNIRNERTGCARLCGTVEAGSMAQEALLILPVQCSHTTNELQICTYLYTDTKKFIN